MMGSKGIKSSRQQEDLLEEGRVFNVRDDSMEQSLDMLRLESEDATMGEERSSELEGPDLDGEVRADLSNQV
ncbi:hypothetical protein B296_00011105 [Ensete ventricosum]|uniref:Uncharacterized protein n=1 Tax=Ensete ventricosum TaxID=4639 RepID=A0A427AZW1_ENSVE|nr:hypothetical protein B296_00011105 [Ensete ventricosum]